MASYATIPADVETNESAQPLVVNKQTSGLKRLVAGAAMARGEIKFTARSS